MFLVRKKEEKMVPFLNQAYSRLVETLIKEPDNHSFVSSFIRKLSTYYVPGSVLRTWGFNWVLKNVKQPKAWEKIIF